MAKKASRSKGVRPVRHAWLYGLASFVGSAFVLKGAMDMRETGQSGSWYLMLGLFPALLCPIGFVYCLRKSPVVRNMRNGTTAIARWTVSPDEFRRFCEADARIATETRNTNFYEPPNTIPAEGMEVVFSDDGVLIGEGYFPLSISRGRCVYSVRSIASGAPMIEFETVLTTKVRTSSATMGTVRTRERLRVPVAANATSGINDVVRKFEVALASL